MSELKILEGLKVHGDLKATGAVYDSNDSPGTSGQLLQSTATGTDWVDATGISAGDAEAVHLAVKNTSGATITKGTPVYITGNVGNSDRLEVAPADASDASKMPAVGLLESDLANNAEGYVAQGGYLKGLSTATIDGTSTSSNDTVYVKAGGGLTMTKPTGTNYIQNVAKIARVHASNGSLVVSSILRTNDVPAPLYVDHTNQRVGVGTPTPTNKFEIYGGTGVSTTGTLVVRQSGDGLSDGISLTSSNATSHRIWKNAAGTLNIGPSSSPSALVQLLNGNVGIGTTSPLQTLHAAGPAYFSGGTNAAFQSGGDTRSNTAITIDRGDKITVRRGQYLRTLLWQDSTNDIIKIGETGTSLIAGINLEAGHDGSAGSAQVRVYGGSTEYVRFDGYNKRVGIGTTSPSYALDVASSSARIGDSNQTTTTLYVEATNTAGAPARTANIHFKGYEGRAQGVFYEDSSYGSKRWFSGLRYSGGFANYQIGYDASGDQAEYLANSMLSVNSSGDLSVTGNATINGVITATGGNSTNWNTAYGWGDHSSAGYTSNVGDITGVTAGAGLSGGGSSGTVLLAVEYLTAVDDRDMKPNTSGVGSSVKGIKPFFSSLGGMTGTADSDYQDVLVLDTYSDLSGGSANALTFDKSDKKIRHWLAAQNATTWGTAKTLAYTDDNISTFNNDSGYTTNTGTVDTSGTPVDNDFAKFTDSNTVEGRSYSEVKSDLSLNNVTNESKTTMFSSPTFTTTAIISHTAPTLRLTDTNATNTTDLVAYTSFQVNGVENGWIGYGSNSNSHLSIKNNNGYVRLDGSLGTYIDGYATIENGIRHANDDNNKIDFGTDTQTFTTAGASRLIIGSAGVMTANVADFRINEYIKHNGDTDTYLRFQDDVVDLYAGGTRFLTAFESTQDVLIVNEGGTDVDFRVESNNNANMLFVDGGNDRVGIGTASPDSALHVEGGYLTINSDTRSNIYSTTNGAQVGFKFSDNASSAYGQAGYIDYAHSDTQSYGSGNAFIVSGTEPTLSFVVDGKILYNEGIYKLPTSGTGAGTRKDTNWDTAYGWGDHSSQGYITSSSPAAPTNLVLSVVGQTINVTFTASTTSGINNYLVFGSVSGGDYGLISVIPPADFGATMSIIDDSFDTTGTQAYRIYAVKNGMYSSPLTGSQAYSVSSAEPTNLSVINLNSAYYVQWDPPSSNARFVTAYNIYKHEHATQGSLSRSSASLIYSGLNTSYMYQISGANNTNYHQFWVETTIS